MNPGNAANGWERPPEYDDPPDPPPEWPDFDDPDECEACHGTGEQGDGIIAFDCPECGGDG